MVYSVYKENNNTEAYQAYHHEKFTDTRPSSAVALLPFRLTYHNIDREKVKTLAERSNFFINTFPAITKH